MSLFIVIAYFVGKESGDDCSLTDLGFYPFLRGFFVFYIGIRLEYDVFFIALNFII